ncbi:transporter substrate-binding domain-containing protein [Thermoflavimicrobium dichotomicum]|uniref:Cystine transport system substrate-binding protein n=1 Tax=Thermoflavimicrobium dichotomicum TaxID=46223 RepID=A0A1I3QEN3_9BACL|nr:transporter substrate-binding domain-containing protein [Thermoflavimicrobium dichotomicum]SFJ32664.1 cystine transport system substrate-binding protein [Thermoflavimicrobium dichotomicum]
MSWKRWVIVGISFLLLLTGCTIQKPATEEKKGDLLSQIKKRGSIRIGTEGTYKPFSFHDEKTNQLTGFDVEVAQEIAKRIGVKAEFVEIPWDGMLTSLQNKKIDMVANQVGIKPERKEKFDFSQPYTVSYAQMVVHKDNQEIKSLKQVKGKKAGQTPTSNYGDMARKAGATIVAYEDMMSAMKDVAAKRVDFSLNDRLAIAEMMKTAKLPVKVVGEQIERSESAFPIPKNNPELLKAIDQALESMKKDGTLAKISQKWFGIDVSK